MISILFIFSWFLKIYICTCSTHETCCYFSVIDTPVRLWKLKKNKISMNLMLLIFMLKWFIFILILFELINYFIPILNIKIILIATKLSNKAFHLKICVPRHWFNLFIFSLVIGSILITVEYYRDLSLLFVNFTYTSQIVILYKVLFMTFHLLYQTVIN